MRAKQAYFCGSLEEQLSPHRNALEILTSRIQQLVYLTPWKESGGPGFLTAVTTVDKKFREGNIGYILEFIEIGDKAWVEITPD